MFPASSGFDMTCAFVLPRANGLPPAVETSSHSVLGELTWALPFLIYNPLLQCFSMWVGRDIPFMALILFIDMGYLYSRKACVLGTELF